MENLVLTRIDDRLIHGQVVTAWLKYTDAKTIFVIDDQVAKDDFMISVLTMAAPKGIKIYIIDRDQAIEMLSEPLKNNTMILAKEPKVLKYLIDAGIKIKDIDVAGMGAREGRSVLYKNISISNDEADVFLDLVNAGVNVYIQVMPTHKPIPIIEQIVTK